VDRRCEACANTWITWTLRTRTTHQAARRAGTCLLAGHESPPGASYPLPVETPAANGMMRQVLGLSKGLGAQTKRWAEGGWRWALGGWGSVRQCVGTSVRLVFHWLALSPGECENAGVKVKPRGTQVIKFRACRALALGINF
jgi:hypothetical protein